MRDQNRVTDGALIAQSAISMFSGMANSVQSFSQTGQNVALGEEADSRLHPGE
jgi:hypothetical protein